MVIAKIKETKEIEMKKILFGIMMVLSLSANAQCYTQTFIVNGVSTVCLVCPTITTCN